MKMKMIKERRQTAKMRIGGKGEWRERRVESARERESFLHLLNHSCC